MYQIMAKTITVTNDRKEYHSRAYIITKNPSIFEKDGWAVIGEPFETRREALHELYIWS